MRKLIVIPAEAGIQKIQNWIPIFMGMTEWKMKKIFHKHSAFFISASRLGVAASGGAWVAARQSAAMARRRLHSTFPSAFTLIELIITIAIAGIAILSLVMVFQESLKNMERQKGLQSANLLAEDLMNEIRSKKYVDSDFPTNFGAEAGETNRSLYDDVDDYNSWPPESPPKTIEGDVISNLSGFTWRAFVTNVAPTNFNASPACAPNSTDFKRITVVVSNTAIIVSNMSVVGRYD